MVLSTVEMRTAESIWDRFESYQAAPDEFALEVIGVGEEQLWSKLREVLEAIAQHQKVALKAGHSVSKTFGIGRIIVPWFKVCFQPSTIITTAPSDNQVRNQLWREIHAGYAAAKARGLPLGGRMHILSWDMKPADDILATVPAELRPLWEKNFAIGFSTSADTATEHATKMHGWHNEWMLVVLDEACGLIPQVTRTVTESLLVDEQCRCIAAGNPTDPECDFARWCYSSDPAKNEGKESYMSDDGWWVIRIDARDNPNYITGRRIIPGLASRQYVDGIIAKYGPDGDGTRYRVLGLFATYKEGTYYGDLLAEARRRNRVGKFDHDPAYPVYTFSDYGDMYTATIFVQFIQGRIRIISDYWDAEGQGAPAWARVLQTRKYVYRAHVAGPDMDPVTGSNKKAFATGKLLRDTLLEQGFEVNACEVHDFDSGIRCGRDLWPLLEINEPECTNFLAAAGGYGRVKNQRLSTDERTEYHNQVAQTWHRHLMDAYRHLAVDYRIHQYTGETIKGLKEDEARAGERDAHYDPLKGQRL